jgi:hypothetical protein
VSGEAIMVAVGGIGVLEGTGVGADSGISVGADVEVGRTA